MTAQTLTPEKLVEAFDAEADTLCRVDRRIWERRLRPKLLRQRGPLTREDLRVYRILSDLAGWIEPD